MVWIVVIILVAVCAGCGVLLWRLNAQQQAQHARRRRRYEIDPAIKERIPLLDGDPARPRGPTLRERLLEEAAAERESAADIALREAPSTPVSAQIVRTIDGSEAVLTEPPFVLRRSLFSHRGARYLNELTPRVPAWIVFCPRARIDALVMVSRPAVRDATDWANWRRRARLRAIDVLPCDRRDFRPVLAILWNRPARGGTLVERLRRPDGGPAGDRLIEEILRQVALPVVHASGSLSQDWSQIAPYIDEAILPTRDPCIEGDGAEDLRVSPVAASRLIQMTGEDGLG